MQSQLMFATETISGTLPDGQLLKWIGNKQKFAEEITSFFPNDINRYFEPFLGSGAVLATLAHASAFGSDTFKPLIDIWSTLKNQPQLVKDWYAERHALIGGLTKVEAYEKVKADYNANPNGADLLFLCRVCYGGVVRFRKSDGYMSTPCGAHSPMPPLKFNRRVDDWHYRVRTAEFTQLDFREAFADSRAGDLIYCDPPYSFSQTILYGAQGFSLKALFAEIACAKERGVKVALSIDGAKKSGAIECDLGIPQFLFEREVFVHCGRSMLRRFQMGGQTLEAEHVHDRLLLTY